MKTNTAVIYFLLACLVIILFKTKSFADQMDPVPGSLNQNLLIGAILSKQPDETCNVKYGSAWAEVTPTLCAKIS